MLQPKPIREETTFLEANGIRLHLRMAGAGYPTRRRCQSGRMPLLARFARRALAIYHSFTMARLRHLALFSREHNYLYAKRMTSN